MGVSINTIKKYLAKYGIVNQQRGELAVIKKCNSATSDREKNEAFSQIDAYLLPIAEKKYKSSKAISFDDFMQDLRLKFLELLAKRQNGNKTIPYNIFSAIRNLKFESSPKFLVGKIDLPSYHAAEEKELDAMAETVQDAIASKDINKLKEILKIKVTNGDFLNRPVKNTFHYNAIHYALATRWEAGIKLLLSRSDLDLKVLDGYKRSPLSRAETWNEKIAKMFIEHPSLLQKNKYVILKFF